MKTITREEILWFFEYDRPNGKLYWKNHWYKGVRTRLLGLEAGRTNDIGYRIILLDGVYHLTHRLIYFLETNLLPENVDHINGDTLDNRFCNLRAASRRKNLSNSYRHRTGKLVGTSFRKKEQCWYSRIRIDKKLIHIGAFETEIEAHQAYMKRLNEHIASGGK